MAPTVPSSRPLPAGPEAGPADPIGRRAIRGGAILVAARVFTGGLSALVRIVVIANLIGPEDIGLFAAALLVITGLETLSETGFGRALIQRPGGIGEHIDTAFTTHVVRGCLLAGLIYAGAPWMARIFQGEARLVELLRVVAIVPLLSGFGNTAMVELHRRLDFKRLAVYQIAHPLFDFLVSILHALISPTAWALVSGRIAATAVTVAASYALAPSRPRLRFHSDRFGELGAFGFWVFLSGIVSFLATEGGSAAIGVLLPISSLGIYQLANTVACRGTMLVASALREVTFAAFSRIQTESGRLKRAFRNAFAQTASLVFGLAAVLAAGAPHFIEGVMTPEWSSAVPLIQLLSLWGASRALEAVSSTLFQAVGRPKIATFYQSMMLCVFAGAIYPVTTRYGPVGVAVLLAGVGTGMQVLRLHVLAQLLEESPAALYMTLVATLTSASAGTACGMGVAYLVGGTHALARLAAVVLATGAAYIATLGVWNSMLETELLPSFRWWLARPGRLPER